MRYIGLAGVLYEYSTLPARAQYTQLVCYHIGWPVYHTLLTDQKLYRPGRYISWPVGHIGRWAYRTYVMKRLYSH